MIAAKDAVAIFSKKHSDLTILNIIDYDDKWYIITAVDNPKVVSYSDPYFAVSKQNGSVKGFFPSAEIQKFFKAFRERSLDLKTFKPKSQAGELKHAADTFNHLTDDFLIHYGTPGMHWRQQGPGKRYQSQAVYAQGRPNPDAKVRGSKEQTDKKAYASTMKEYNELPAKERLEMRINAAAGKNYKFNKMITDALRKEKDGTHGRIRLSMLHAGSITPAELRYEIDKGNITFREQAFNRKVSQKYADKILNRCLWGSYTKEKEFPKAVLHDLRKKREANNKRED